jgi:hypothetical protein
MRLKYTIGRVVLVLVSPFLLPFSLMILFEAKLALVTISPTIVTIKLHGHRFSLGMGLHLVSLHSDAQPISPH